MTISLIGSTGKVGIILLKKLLSSECHIKVLVRDREKLLKLLYNQHYENLEILQGDALQQDSLEKLVKDSDIIVSCIGHGKHSPPLLQKRMFEILINLLQNSNKKVITLTGSGVFVPNDKISLWDKILLLPIKLIDGKRVIDGAAHVEVLTKSNLRWTVVRTPLHINYTKSYKVSEYLDGGLKLFVGRNSIVDFLIKCIETDDYVGKLPVIYSN